LHGTNVKITDKVVLGQDTAFRVKWESLSLTTSRTGFYWRWERLDTTLTVIPSKLRLCSSLHTEMWSARKA